MRRKDTRAKMHYRNSQKDIIFVENQMREKSKRKEYEGFTYNARHSGLPSGGQWQQVCEDGGVERGGEVPLGTRRVPHPPLGAVRAQQEPRVGAPVHF